MRKRIALSPTADEEVTLRFLGVFKKAYGSGQASMKIRKNEKLENVIKKISEDSPSLGRVLVDPELSNPLSNAIILVNGKEIGLLNGLETMLKDKDEIVFIPVIHGG
jgi:molybdopterin converting factor small subunit